jgi:hypothetical protein
VILIPKSLFYRKTEENNINEMGFEFVQMHETEPPDLKIRVD